MTASDGNEALEVARSEHPDVVVLDLMLPGVDGIEVCREIRTFSDAYIVMLTAKSEEVDKLIGLAVGADDYLTKPFSLRELSVRLAEVTRELNALMIERLLMMDAVTGAFGFTFTSPVRMPTWSVPYARPKSANF